MAELAQMVLVETSLVWYGVPSAVDAPRTMGHSWDIWGQKTVTNLYK